MEKLIFSVAIVCFIGMMVFGLTQAQTTDEVNATVTVQNIAVSVSDGSITYGILGQNSTTTTLLGGVDDMQTATNDGNVTSTINIRGTNSTNWTLAGTADTDIYTHHFCNETDNDCSTPLASYTALTTDYATLKSGVSVSSTVDFHLHINTPNLSTVFTQQNVNVWVQASI